MKTIKKYAALFCALCTILAVSGCDNNLFKSTLPEGEGAILLSIGGSAGRTIAPSNVPTEAFDLFMVEVFNHGANIETADPVDTIKMEGFSSTLFFLREGSYDFYVQGFVGNNLVAEGSKLDVPVVHNSGTAIEVHIELAPALTGGNGTFVYELTFDANITAATIKIGAAAAKDVFTTKSGEETLPSGQYDVVFTLTYDTVDVVWTERLHVYRNLTSTFIHTFEDLRLETLAARVQALIEAKTIAGSQITEKHLDLLGIKGVDYENISALFSAIDWVSDLKTSVDFALIKLHNFEIPYETIAQLKSAIIGVVKNHTITADAITVSGTTTLTATFTIGGQTATIPGFTIDDRPITGIVLDTDNAQTEYLQFYHPDFSITGLVVTAKHEVGVDTPVDLELVNVTPTDVNLATAGTKEITVALKNHPEITAKYEITVIALDDISINADTVTKNYYQFIPATVNLTNLEVTGHWGSTEHPVAYTGTTGTDLNSVVVETSETKPVTITYNSKSKSFNVTVHELTSIKLTIADEYAEAPTYHNILNLLKTGDILVTGTYGSIPQVLNTHIDWDNDTSINIKVFPDLVPGKGEDYTVEFGWKGFECKEYTFTYNDTTSIISSISISDNNNKKFYQYFTDFSNDGIVVTAHWTQGGNDTIVPNTSATFNSTTFRRDISGTYAIEVTFEGHSASYNVTVIAPDTGIVIEGDLVTKGIGELEEHPEEDEILALITSASVTFEGGTHPEVITLAAHNIIIDKFAETVIIKWQNNETAPYPYSIKTDDDNP